MSDDFLISNFYQKNSGIQSEGQTVWGPDHAWHFIRPDLFSKLFAYIISRQHLQVKSLIPFQPLISDQNGLIAQTNYAFFSQLL